MAIKPALAIVAVLILLLARHVARAEAAPASTEAKPALGASARATASSGAPKRSAAKAKGQVANAKGQAAKAKGQAAKVAVGPLDSASEIAAVEDPVALVEAGKRLLAEGQVKLAEKSFVASIARHEINVYRKLKGTSYAKALVKEWLGQPDAAAKLWRSGIARDPLASYFFVAHFSEHAERGAILDEIKAHVLAQVAALKSGQRAHIYTTKKGAKRYLKLVTQEEAEEAFAKGETLRYAYLDDLDLTGKVWPAKISCQRCVVGSLRAWGATFEEQLSFKGFVLDKLHLGKKWKGKVNKSATIPGGIFRRLYLGQSVIFGDSVLDSVKVTGRVANLPFTVFVGEANLRNIEFSGTAEFRFAHFRGQANLRGATFGGSTYFSHSRWGDVDMSRSLVKNHPLHFASAIFDGKLVIEDAAFHHGLIFEHALFKEDVLIRRIRSGEVVNFSRMVAEKAFSFRRNEVKDLIFFGGLLKGMARFDDCVVSGKARFSPDELTRRQHLQDVAPLHKRYKLYQGDDDAEEDLTRESQYGVRKVDDLVSRFEGGVSFANTYFSKFVGFERVVFGKKGERDQVTDFYNAQFSGEAHFERAIFNGIADFRTIAGLELAFNQARFHGPWMLDDANVRGRLTATETQMLNGAVFSIAGADITSFGGGFDQLLDDPNKPWERAGHRLFYARCVRAYGAGKGLEVYEGDIRLEDASWQGEERVTDPKQLADNMESICLSRAIDEYTRLRDWFQRRSMSEESDWAYWHLKHYQNFRAWRQGSLRAKAYAAFEWLLFEKAFGWGVLLTNLLATAAVAIVFFAFMTRILCGDMLVDWDNKRVAFKKLPIGVMIIVSMHSFLGGLGDAESLLMGSGKRWKYLFTLELMVGIIVITFFIGAYTRLVVSGGV